MATGFQALSSEVPYGDDFDLTFCHISDIMQT